MKSLLEKWQCNTCDESFLIDMARAKDKQLCCPFCKEIAESVANQNPDLTVSLEDQLDGCLWPL